MFADYMCIYFPIWNMFMFFSENDEIELENKHLISVIS